ncbi:MAG: DNA helicase RecG, partial [Alkaliphilus sp.]|nr:DNA helicase RecG [Alkaliphilus sp.]
MDRLKKNILSIEGIGPKKLKYYNKLGINKIEDFLYNFPRDYQNRKEIKRINELQDGETSSIMATVIGKATQVLIKKNFIIYKLP